MCKYYVSWNVEESGAREVVLCVISLTNEKDEFVSKDIISWMMRLDIYWKPFDNTYSKYDIMRSSRNEQFELSFFYSHKAQSIYMAIRCLEDNMSKRVIGLLEELKILKRGKSIENISLPNRIVDMII